MLDWLNLYALLGVLVFIVCLADDRGRNFGICSYPLLFVGALVTALWPLLVVGSLVFHVVNWFSLRWQAWRRARGWIR